MHSVLESWEKNFVYDGTVQKRVRTFNLFGANRSVGLAPDIVGLADMVLHGSVPRMNYVIYVSYEGTHD